MVGKHGKPIGYRISNECNSWLFGDPGEPLRVGGFDAAQAIIMKCD